MIPSSFLTSIADFSSMILNIFLADYLALATDGTLDAFIPAPNAAINRMYILK
jgi:hypothetical protein